MTKTNKVPYEVVCHKNAKHVFSVVFDVIPDANSTSKAEVYCPECDTLVRVTIKGKLPPNQEVLRRFHGSDEQA